MSESAPWSQPGLPMKMLARSWQADAPFRLRLRADPAQWRWLLAFLANSRAGPHHAGRMRNLALGRYSLACLQRTRAELGNDFAYDDAQKGILQLVPTGASINLDHIRDQTARGVPVSWLGPEEIAAVEPALASAVEDGLLRALSGARRMRAATRICLLSALSGHFRGALFATLQYGGDAYHQFERAGAGCVQRRAAL